MNQERLVWTLLLHLQRGALCGAQRFTRNRRRNRQTDRFTVFWGKSGDEGPKGVESELKVSRVLEVLKNFSLGLHTGVLTFEFRTF